MVSVEEEEEEEEVEEVGKRSLIVEKGFYLRLSLSSE
ncbi:MAG: hypothetical protein ACJAQT_004811 [Akkermansiaceae bacterium]|jgi:hypothetical protein